jgi:hypothetical protein
LDLLIVSGRRPELLSSTLESIDKKIDVVFDNVIVNIDNWVGSENDAEKTKSIIKSYYPYALINEPSVPNFCQAVKFLWENIKSDYALHTEDDWNWIDSFSKDELVKETKGYGMARFKSKENAGGNIYGTSPCVITREFGHDVSKYFDVSLDPEKQFRQGNLKFRSAVKKYRTKCIKRSDPSIVDIGRTWRDDRKIEKIVTGAKSSWINSGEN